MADLSNLLKRTAKGSASESASQYFGGELRHLLSVAEGEIENAFMKGTDLRGPVAKWLSVRELMRTFERDLKDGQSAEKEMARG